MSRKFKAHLDELNYSETEMGLRTQSPVAVYYRQSTDAQVGNISTAIQTLDMVSELERRGWNKENIILIDTDGGVSGTTRIDEREGMSQLFELITEGKIRTVACQDEDRLFRDVTQIQVNIFIEACRKSKVQVITPFMTYDFAHPLHGDFHTRQFRFKSEMAAEYIKSYILGRLVPAKRHMAKEGKWIGARVPVGYMVDMRKNLSDGTENAHWRKFVPFEPYAQIVQAYFRIFLESGGNVKKTMRRIREERISFPECPPPAGYKTSYQLKKRGDGIYLTRSNTVRLLTSPVYAGHWCHNNVVINWNNHPPLVSQEEYTKSFNYLSKYSLTGDDNLNYRPATQYASPNLDEKRLVDRPLCSGLIYSCIEGAWVRVSTIFDGRAKCYLYSMNGHDYMGMKSVWARRANWIDAAIITKFRERLQATFNVDEWVKVANTFDETVERELRLKRSQQSALEAAMKNLVAGIPLLTNADLIKQVENQYNQMDQEKKRYMSEISNLEQQKNQTVSLEQAIELFRQAAKLWDEMTQDEHRNVLSIFIDRIEATDYNRAGDMRLIVSWRDKSQDTIQVWHKPHSKHWTVENVAGILSLFDAGATQLEIASTLPDLTWSQIYNEIKKHRGRVRFTPSWLGKNETYNEYEASGGRKGKASGSYWREDELTQLRAMVESAANQQELMEQFPHRRWIQLKARITEIFGKGTVDTPLSGINQKLTYIEYVQQTNNEVSNQSEEDSLVVNCDPNSEIAGANS